MHEYLRIENFGPITYLELPDIRPLTVFIGKSGSGKSTVMKVLSLFRWIYKRVNLRSFLVRSGVKSTNISFKTERQFRRNGLLPYMSEKSVIEYRCGSFRAELRNKRIKLLVRLIPTAELSLEKVCFISDKRSIIPDILSSPIDRHKDNFYLQDTLDNFREAVKAVTQLEMPFLDVNFRAERTKNQGIQYRLYGDGEQGQYNLPLRDASSGMQTATPLSVIVEYFARYYNLEDSMNSALLKFFTDLDKLRDFRAALNVGEFPSKRVHIFIEEPELSLYPDNQTELLDFLVQRCFSELHNYEMTLMMATHSPYIVNYLNLFIRRFEAGVDTPYRISPDDIEVYSIEDGYATRLKMDGKQGVIINSSPLSDPIAQIYTDYNSL